MLVLTQACEKWARCHAAANPDSIPGMKRGTLMQTGLLMNASEPMHATSPDGVYLARKGKGKGKSGLGCLEVVCFAET